MFDWLTSKMRETTKLPEYPKTVRLVRIALRDPIDEQIRVGEIKVNANVQIVTVNAKMELHDDVYLYAMDRFVSSHSWTVVAHNAAEFEALLTAHRVRSEVHESIL